MDIIRKYPLFYGKCAARCLVALCCSKEIPSVVQDLINYLKQNFYKIDKNIFANMIFLLQELVAKIKNSKNRKIFKVFVIISKAFKNSWVILTLHYLTSF